MGNHIRFNPGYHFLGPGTNLDWIKYAPANNKLDQAAKMHDLEYSDLRIKTVDANAKFLKNTEDTGIAGAAM